MISMDPDRYVLTVADAEAAKARTDTVFMLVVVC